jgi:dTDP-4-amino-4,6-dideoxygalactose transaminase
MENRLALLGGPKAVADFDPSLFAWPIITREDEEAVLGVLRAGNMSGTDVTKRFEDAFGAWLGMPYALGFNNGTSAVQGAMFACRIGVGDEIIVPSVTYWASVIQSMTLGGTPVFADIDPTTLCMDPNDIEWRIGPRTKAILVVHYLAHPADMDPIMEIAKKHGLKVIEDFSHAQGGLYKGRRVGTIGDVGATSLMSGKSLAIGEAGMLVTRDRAIYERAAALGHYERFDASFTSEDLKPYAGLPMGGYKFRMHQLSSAVGLVQLKYYDERCEEIRKAMNYFWDQLEGVPGIRAHRVAKDSGSDMAGWYGSHGLYFPEELGGLSITRYTEAVRAEGVDDMSAGANAALHTHALFQTCDVYGAGKPTRIANAERDVRTFDASLPVSEGIGARSFFIPWFKHFDKTAIDGFVEAYRKVSENYRDLLPGDPGNPARLGGWHFFKHTKKK